MSPYLSRLRNLGFSLIEMVVVISVLGIVAAVGSSMLRSGFIGYLRGNEIAGADWQGRLAMERMTRELRTIAYPNYSNVTGSSCSSFTFAFSDVTGTQISYTRSGNTLMRNNQSLASSVSGLRFSCLLSDAQTYSTGSSAPYYVSISMIVSTTNTSAVYRTSLKPASF